MNSFISKAVTFAIGIFMICVVAFPMTAFAADTVAAPVLSEKAVFSGKFELSLENSGKYSKGTKFEIWVDGKYARSASIETLKDNGYVFEICGGKKYFAPSEKHSVKIKAVSGSKSSSFSKTFSATTKAKTVYYAAKGKAYYKLSGSKLVKAGTLSDAIYSYAVLADAKGVNCEGKSVSANTAKYIKLTSGSYKNYYISVSKVRRQTDAQVKAATPVKPALSAAFVTADKIGVGITNLKNFRAGTTFTVYVNGKKLKTVKLAAIQRDGFISILNDTATYFKKNTSYKIDVEATSRQLTSKAGKTISTTAVTYFKLNKGTQLYKYRNGSWVKADKIAVESAAEGVYVTYDNKALAGKSVKKYSGAYVKITSGSYKGLFLKPAATNRLSEKTAKNLQNKSLIDTVVEYAKSNVGGCYVSCGERFRATDCCGLTMLAYRQIGVNLPHSVSGQAARGTRVSVSNMKAGDIVISNNYGHAMLYIGNGQIVHAMNPRDGIKIQAASTAMRYNPVNCVVRIL